MTYPGEHSTSSQKPSWNSRKMQIWCQLMPKTNQALRRFSLSSMPVCNAWPIHLTQFGAYLQRGAFSPGLPIISHKEVAEGFKRCNADRLVDALEDNFLFICPLHAPMLSLGRRCPRVRSCPISRTAQRVDGTSHRVDLYARQTQGGTNG